MLLVRILVRDGSLVDRRVGFLVGIGVNSIGYFLFEVGLGGGRRRNRVKRESEVRRKFVFLV